MSQEPSMDLNLWKKRVAHVPDAAWERSEIEALVSAENDLTAIPAKIGDLLKHLSMFGLAAQC
jgi:hypothetical protein